MREVDDSLRRGGFPLHLLGSDVFRKAAIANSAARKSGGDTMHALLKLPMSYIGDKTSHLKGQTLLQFRQRFHFAKTLFVDECSMVGRPQWLQTDVRLKQAKFKNKQDHRTFGGMALLTTGDLLQLPPVGKASVCDPPPENQEAEDETTTKKKSKTPDESRRAEELGGHHLWQSFRTVTTLTQNKRAKGPLAEILQQIRKGTLTDANWTLLQSRLIGTQVVDGKVCMLP